MSAHWTKAPKVFLLLTGNGNISTPTMSSLGQHDKQQQQISYVMPTSSQTQFLATGNTWSRSAHYQCLKKVTNISHSSHNDIYPKKMPVINEYLSVNNKINGGYNTVCGHLFPTLDAAWLIYLL